MMQNSHTAALVVDLGGTKIITAVVFPDGSVVSRNYCLTLANEGPEAVINRVLSGIDEVLAKTRIKTSNLCGLGIAAAGIIDTTNGVIKTSPNLPGWCDIPLRDILANELGIAVYIINDASAAALGEHRFGAGKGVDNLIYLTVSTGIGGGIIIAGELYLGTDGCAGELGHMTIESQGPKCNCGNSGCLEVLASGTAMAKEAKRRLGQGEVSSILTLVDGMPGDITAKTVAMAAKQGDALACDVVARTANYLGIGLANLINIFNPDVIVIGGGVSKIGEMLLKPAREVAKKKAFQMPAQTVRILRARLGDNAGIIGAAAYIFECNRM